MNALKRIGWSLLTILGVGLIIFLIFDESLPEGRQGEDAERLSQRMLKAVDSSAWKNTGAVTWEFHSRSRIHKHIWDRKRHWAQVEFDGYIIQIDIDGRRGIVVSDNDLGEMAQSKLCKKAWKYWINDSFWLNPVVKIYDPGTKRSLVTLDDGSEALLISYSQGGVTPGDSYLWMVDENFRPVAWKLWVSIIPIDGFEFSWENWINLSTGAQISTFHHGVIDIKLENVKGAVTLQSLTGGSDIFDPLEANFVKF